ncbi:MAG: hypothetical protein ACOVJ8_01385 [Sediminibacterium sp.]
MTTSEVFNQITKEHKWYAPYMSAQSAYLFKKRFVNGKLKQSSIESIFAKFGYSQEQVKWNKG